MGVESLRLCIPIKEENNMSTNKNNLRVSADPKVIHNSELGGWFQAADMASKKFSTGRDCSALYGLQEPFNRMLCDTFGFEAVRGLRPKEFIEEGVFVSPEDVIYHPENGSYRLDVCALMNNVLVYPNIGAAIIIEGKTSFVLKKYILFRTEVDLRLYEYESDYIVFENGLYKTTSETTKEYMVPVMIVDYKEKDGD